MHSSINHGKVWVFTGETYSEGKHALDQLVDKFHVARTHRGGELLFALGSSFFDEHLPELDGAIILVMGCDTAASDELAQVFFG